MVGHLLCYHPGVRQLADLIARGELGEVYYLYSQRVNLGKLRADENALWSLGAHDVSVLLELADGNPSEVSARGEAYVRDGVEDVVFAYIRFDTGLAAHLHLSWLDPHKMRKLTVVGSERMATLDDMALERKLTIWDKGFDPSADDLRRVHHPLWRGLEPGGSEPGAAAPRVRALRRVHPNGRTPHTDGPAGVRWCESWRRSRSPSTHGGAPQAVAAPVGSGAGA